MTGLGESRSATVLEMRARSEPLDGGGSSGVRRPRFRFHGPRLDDSTSPSRSTESPSSGIRAAGTHSSRGVPPRPRPRPRGDACTVASSSLHLGVTSTTDQEDIQSSRPFERACPLRTDLYHRRHPHSVGCHSCIIVGWNPGYAYWARGYGLGVVGSISRGSLAQFGRATDS